MSTSPPPGLQQDVACPGLDALLARLAAADSEQDWAELISRHGRFIRQACRSRLANEAWIDDAVQETLISVRRDLVRYRRMTDAEAGAWLQTIAVHRACNLNRNELSRHQREQRTRREASTTSDPELDLEDLHEQRQLLIRAVASLSPLQSAILRLHFVEGQSYLDIALKLGISPAKAQRQGHRAMARLRSLHRPQVANGQCTVGLFAILTLISDGRCCPPKIGAASIGTAGTGMTAKTLTVLA